MVENRWGNTPPACPRKVASFPPSRTPASPKVGRSTCIPRGSVAVSENDSIQDIHQSPGQEKMAITFGSSCLRTPDMAIKMTVSSIPYQKSPTEETVASTSTASGSSDPIFNRWDSTPAICKHLKEPSSVLSLRSCAAQKARTHRKPTRGRLFTVHIQDKLHKDPDLILSPPRKPVRRGSFERIKEQDLSDSTNNSSDTASLLEEALRITAEAQYDDDPFGVDMSRDGCQKSLKFALPL